MEGGKCVRLSGTFQDITDRMQAEEEKNQILTLSQDWICVAGMDGYFRYVNLACENTLASAYNSRHPIHNGWLHCDICVAKRAIIPFYLFYYSIQQVRMFTPFYFHIKSTTGMTYMSLKRIFIRLGLRM